MTELEELKRQIGRMQAMLEAQQHLLMAMFGHAEHPKEIMQTFKDLQLATQDLLHFEPLTDAELSELLSAHHFLRDSLTKTESWLKNSK